MKLKSMLVILIFGMITMTSVVFAACPLCGSSNYSKSLQTYSASQHKVIHNCPASTGCGGGISYENHSFSSTVVTSPTCSATGLRKYSCACGYSYTEAIAKTAHTYGNFTPNGTSGHRKKCVNCSAYTATIAHTYAADLQLSIGAPTVSHCKRCTACGYENNTQVHTMTATPKGQVDGSYVHELACLVCNKYTLSNQICTFDEGEMITEATCTQVGTTRYTCKVCSQSYTNTATVAHVWSDYMQTSTEHYKICTYGCGNEDSRGTHIDTFPRDGRCDVCNYLMYVLPVANISGATAVKETETATFSVNVTEGSQPLTYQWFYKTSADGEEIKIDGETKSSINLVTTKEMNGNYYYCMVTNPGGDYITLASQLTVYYDFEIGTHPQDATVKKGETATFNVDIGTYGNPNEYTYQWYIASSLTGAGSKLPGATSNTYTVTPNKNIHEEYYYCVISNSQYTHTSNRAKLVADITLPTVEMGTFNQNIIINKNYSLKVPFSVTDTGEGYTEDETNFTAEDILVKVDNELESFASKKLVYNGSNGNTHNYELTVTNIDGNGKLSFEVPDDSVIDNVGNTNIGKNFNTNVLIDNAAPIISLQGDVKGIENKYANSEKKLTIQIAITESAGMNSNELQSGDIVVKVGGIDIEASANKKITYLEKKGDEYIYTLTLSNLTGNGELTLEIPAGSVKDLAANTNDFTELKVLYNLTEMVTIDNIKPEIQSLVTKLDSYISSRDYPTALDARHNQWANENVYVQINATDTEAIDYYSKSTDGNTYNKMLSNQEVLSESINTEMHYRVYDKAGNYSEVTKQIKIDKIFPQKPVMQITEQRVNGIDYVFNALEPTNKSIYVTPKASSVADYGEVKSGIELDKTYTYYTISKYSDINKLISIGETQRYSYDELIVLNDTGYYEIEMFLTDIAGNQVKSDVYKVYINKGAENTIRILNINDIGSGISRATINVYNDSTYTNKAIPEIVVDEPYKEIVKNVRLGEGTFYVRVILLDKVGNKTILETTITNSL